MIAAVGAGLNLTLEDAVRVMRPEPARAGPDPKDTEVCPRYPRTMDQYISGSG